MQTGFVDLAAQCLNQSVVSLITIFCQDARPALTQEKFQRGTKKREMVEIWKQYIDDISYTVVEKWKCEWWTP